MSEQKVCEKSPTGEHVPDPRSGVQTLDDYVVEYECIHCFGYGSVKLDPAEIKWE